MGPQGWGLALAKLGFLSLLWRNVFTMEVPLDLRQPPTIIKQSMKEHLVDPKEGIFIECEAKGNPFPVFSWRKNGKFYNVPRDPWVTMRRWSGTLDMATGAKRRPEDYEAEYQCFATNDYGSAVSDKIRLRVSTMMPIRQDRRVSMGVNGDLYFSHIIVNDSLTDYSCNARFKATQTIQQKSPYTLKVLT
ncbi:hypothetical protein JZ751_023374, partial [Albula glossodonta]